MRPSSWRGLFVLLLPLAVAAFDLSLPTALLLVAVALVWQWLNVLKFDTEHEPAEIVLESIGASHYVEKVRWCLDILGIDYVEQIHGGTLGAFYRGRTVPVLRFRTGRVISSIGNSPEILRYLWGTCSADGTGKAAFLEPLPERIELEQRLDRYGRNLQVWLYWHLLDERDLVLDAWGVDDLRVPALERRLLRLLYPVQRLLMRRTFRLNQAHFEKSRAHIERLLGEVDSALRQHPQSILGDAEPNYTDYAFAALSSLWVLPPNLAGRSAGPVLERARLPAAMREDLETFGDRYPAALEFAERLYRDARPAEGAKA